MHLRRGKFVIRRELRSKRRIIQALRQEIRDDERLVRALDPYPPQLFEGRAKRLKRIVARSPCADGTPGHGIARGLEYDRDERLFGRIMVMHGALAHACLTSDIHQTCARIPLPSEDPQGSLYD